MVCVFCGSSPGVDPDFVAVAGALGSALARAGHGLVYGAGGAGLMGAVADGVLAEGGHVIGVIPQALVDKEYGRHDLPDLRIVADMHERKATMYAESDAFVTLPGGIGTFEEFFETLTWSQLGLHDKPMVVLNTGGYYDPLRTLLEHALVSGFVHDRDRAIVRIVDTVDEVLAELEA